ncbi:MAG TPA: hypothetical protein VN759_03725 [Pseudolysinimonas sp.]|nr:hypothetical protein [Pseudolysinimonas sp.]
MHTGPDEPPPWQVAEDASRDVLVALYLRDALGVIDPSGLPRLLGTGLPAVEAADDRTTYRWMRWWVSTVDPDGPAWGGQVLPPDEDDAADPYLAAVARHLDSARAWADVVHEQYTERSLERADFTIQDVVAEREAELGRAARPFRLRIEVLPLTTAGLWWIGENAIAVDELLRDEPLMYADALRPIVAQLA